MRRVHILPNLFTTANLFFGFYSIVLSMKERYETAAWMILLSIIMDVLDGRVARLTKSSSDFGVQYDSLADLVSFGMAPAILSYKWVLYQAGRIGWLVGFMFVTCGALRLARFNVLASANESGDYFVGYPIPAAASLIAAFYLFTTAIGGLSAKVTEGIMLVLIIFTSFLMISTIKYPAFKKRVPSSYLFHIVFCFVLLIVIVASHPKLFLFGIFFLYCLSGPFIFLKESVFIRHERMVKKTDGV